MRTEKTLTLGDRDITVKELTVADIRAWLRDLELMPPDQPVDVVDVLLFEDFRLTDFIRLTDLDEVAIAALTPAELHQVMKRVEEVNADFFALRRRLTDLGMLKLQPAAAPASIGPQ